MAEVSSFKKELKEARTKLVKLDVLRNKIEGIKGKVGKLEAQVSKLFGNIYC